MSWPLRRLKGVFEDYGLRIYCKGKGTTSIKSDGLGAHKVPKVGILGAHFHGVYLS